MKSTIFFKGSGGMAYIYDSKNKYLLNVHPLIEQIHEYHLLNFEEVKKMVMGQNSEIENDEFEYYYNKYLFLKSAGFFSEINVDTLLSGRVTADLIEKHLSDLDQLVFQVTNDCNFKCKYCCFGDLYNGIPVERKEMDLDMVKQVFDYLIPFWNSKKNSSYKSVISIGFYGGEPLLNFKLIEQIVEYCESLQLNNHVCFEFNMTTNAMLLPKYIDFLVKHHFFILISLDGNEINDSYRVDGNNQPTFKRVFANVKLIQEKYPEYFKERVEFNSVLTNKATVDDIHNFIFSNFSKTPLIDAVSTTDLKESELGAFEQISQKYDENIDLMLERGQYSSVGMELSRFFYYNLNNAYRHYADLMTKENELSQRIPTGTCLPFWKKMYISSTGNIMACEKIAMGHILGHISSEPFMLDFDYIANLYNSYYDHMRMQCCNCYQIHTCPTCIFQTKFEEGFPVCPHVISEGQHQFYLGRIISILEKNTNSFLKFNKSTFA